MHDLMGANMSKLPRGLVTRAGSSVIWINVYYKRPGEKKSRRFYRSTRETSVKRATEYLMDVRRAIRDGTFIEKYLNEPKGELMLSQGVKWYLENYIMQHTVKEKNREDARRILTDFIDAVGDKPMISVTRADVERYKTERLAVGNSHGSINRHLGTIGGLFSRLARKDIIASNPIAGKIDYYPESTPRDRYASPDELRTILSSIQSHELKMIVLIAVFTGMRLSNITTLRLTDLNFERGYFQFVQVKQRPGDPAKTNVVPMSRVLLPLLQRYVVKYQIEEKLFKFESQTVTNMWIAKMKELGIPGLRFHDLRRTLATYLRNNTDADMFLIAKILGHSQPDITNSVYAVTEVERKRKAIDDGFSSVSFLDGIEI